MKRASRPTMEIGFRPPFSFYIFLFSRRRRLYIHISKPIFYYLNKRGDDDVEEEEEKEKKRRMERCAG
jgi:hypothetical protein